MSPSAHQFQQDFLAAAAAIRNRPSNSSFSHLGQLPEVIYRAITPHPVDFSFLTRLIYTLCDAIILLDDVIDGDVNLPSWQKRFSYINSQQIAIGSTVNMAAVLLSEASLDLQRLPQHYNLSPTAAADIQQRFFETVRNTSIGQQMSIGLAVDSLDEAWHVAESKSCPFYRFAAWSGARLATDDPAVHAAFDEIGRLVGLVIQINDDIHDLEIGQEQPSDIAAGVVSLPIAYTLSVLEGKNRDDFRTLLQKATRSADCEKEALRIILASGAMLYLRTEMYQLSQKAWATLSAPTLPPLQLATIEAFWAEITRISQMTTSLAAE